MGHDVRCIVVGIDGSEPARRAVEWATVLAHAFDARLVAVHAVGLLEGSGFAPTTDVPALLASLGADTATVGFAEPGPADQVLLRVAAREQADLVVVGTRGLGGSRRALGSTSEAVLAAAQVPVVVVPVR